MPAAAAVCRGTANKFNAAGSPDPVRRESITPGHLLTRSFGSRHISVRISIFFEVENQYREKQHALDDHFDTFSSLGIGIWIRGCCGGEPDTHTSHSGDHHSGAATGQRQ